MDHCPICEHRISEWMITGDKTSVIETHRLHNSCLIDFRTRHKREWTSSDMAVWAGIGDLLWEKTK